MLAGMDEPGEDLVLAMPRRELFSVSGFVTDIEMRVLESLDAESWFAAPSILHDDIEAKEVRLGLLVDRGDAVLVTADGVALHVTSIPAGVSELGEGLRALRELARGAGRALLGRACGAQLVGYYNDDALPESRPFFVLVYLVRVADDCAPPDGMAWVGKTTLGDLPLDPASSVVVGTWLRPRESSPPPG